MSFDWKDFYSIAEHLRDNAENGLATEAALRSAVGRAYYAAFCHARDVAIAKYGYHTLKNEDHVQLRIFFQKKRMPRIATCLESLRQWRTDCDYESNLELSCLTSMVSGIGKATYILKTLQLA